MKSDIPNIDLVYLWVDGNDPKWKIHHQISMVVMSIMMS
ncbi:MAG: Stealth CR1 domain-containing protein [Flavobacteriaceae bacterium]